MRRIAIASLAIIAALAALAGTAAGATLANTSFSEDVDVTIVYVGIEEGQVSAAAVEAGLPESYRPQIRYKRFYGLLPEADLGTTYEFTYRHVFANSTFEGALTTFLNANAASQASTFGAQTATPTLFQADYSAQTNALANITSNKWISGPATEAKLAELASGIGVDVTKPTIFFVNASGVGHHTYVKTDMVDPDTGYSFGVIRGSRKMTAWGGTPNNGAANDGVASSTDRRVWFYDLSAGPEGWSDNWNVDDADLDGDGVRDYRIPPLWHYQGTPLAYTHPGDTAPATLSTDLGKVARYVAIDLLFASSPLYPPYFQANRIPTTVELDINTVEWWNNVDVSGTFVKPSYVRDEAAKLPAGPSIVLGSQQDLPFSGDWARCYQWFSSDKKLCFNDLFSPIYAPFANPFLAAARNTGSFLDNPGLGTYEAALINYGVGTKPKTPGGLLGFADDNWLDATQSGIFSFVYPEVVPLGYGLTTTMTHEYGHHSSMSHPHDGYDFEDDVDFGPGGDTQFAWLGDMSDTIMSYLDLSRGFGQFDQDNSARHHAAGYAQIAKAIAAGLPAGTNLTEAETKLATAQMAFGTRNYSTALSNAKDAYGLVVAAAGGLANVPVLTPSTWTIAGPIKNGNGNKNERRAVPSYAKDLHEQYNVKRVYAK